MSYRAPGRTLTAAPAAIAFVARHPIVFGIGLAIAVCLSAGLQFLEKREEMAGERRFAVRVAMAATFVSSYMDALRLDQRSTARAYLADGRVADAGFARIVRANRFSGALLLDDSGRVQEAHPRQPGLIGTRLDSRYEHLRRALMGRRAVSNVVLSATEGLPVVAIAIPIETPLGRGVFSTSYELGSSPLAAYMASAMPMSGDDAYLVDANGTIVASRRSETRMSSLDVRDETLAAAVSRRRSGVLAGEGGERYFVARRVEGTPWRLVAARPLAEVHPSWHGGRRWVSAALAGSFGAAVLVICALLARLLETRTRLLGDVARRRMVEAELVRERALLAHRATHDPLTGLANRTLLFSRMEQASSGAAGTSGRRAGVLFIDLDGFKPVNDEHGHDVGDRVLKAVADRLRHVVRPGDTVARVGGDEFAILCDPLPGDESACAIAERIRATLEQPIAIGDGRTVSVGASVGIAERATTVADPHQLLADADAAMYASKVARRGDGDRIAAPAGDQ